MEKLDIQEMISALADGQLEGEALDRAIRTLAADAQARSTWHTYHVIGDVLRTGDLRTGTAPAAFLADFQLRLQREQATAGAPVVVVADAAARSGTQRTALPFDAKIEASNDASFRWKLVAGFASLAAVSALAWSVVGGISKPEQAQMAVAAPPAATAVADAGRPVMIRDPRLDEMLAAHRQFGGGASALQMPAGFLRNATFEGPAR